MAKTGKLVNTMKVDTNKLLKGAVGAAVAMQELEEGVAKASEHRAKGRPPGAKNRDVDQVDAPPTACKKCGSTRREPYANRRELPIHGVCNVTGQPYTSIVYRRTSCSDCGQYRDDRTLVNGVVRAAKK